MKSCRTSALNVINTVTNNTLKTDFCIESKVKDLFFYTDLKYISNIKPELCRTEVKIDDVV